LFDTGPIDPGTGIVSFKWPERQSWADSLPLFDRPGDRAPRGYFVYASDGQGGWTYAVLWPEAVTPNVIEFGYEIGGVPLDSITADRRWARLLPGFAAGDVPLRAWASLDTNRLEVLSWAQHLLEQELFFRSGVTPEFSDAPDGRRAGFPLAGDGRDYVLYPVAARGPWLRVRAVTPSDTCGQEAEARQTAELWIRYLDGSGRPRVWYHTRGC
jgi:hypothetical protein